MASTYRILLLQIAKNLTENNLEDLKFLCSDVIGESELEKIRSAVELFKTLERHDLLGIDDLSFVQELLTNVQCRQLASKVEEFTSRRELELLALNKQRDKVKGGNSGCMQTDGFPREDNDPDGRVDMALAVSCECKIKSFFLLSASVSQPKGGLLLGILGGSVPPGSPNPDPI